LIFNSVNPVLSNSLPLSLSFPSPQVIFLLSFYKHSRSVRPYFNVRTGTLFRPHRKGVNPFFSSVFASLFAIEVLSKSKYLGSLSCDLHSGAGFLHIGCSFSAFDSSAISLFEQLTNHCFKTLLILSFPSKIFAYGMEII